MKRSDQYVSNQDYNPYQQSRDPHHSSRGAQQLPRTRREERNRRVCIRKLGIDLQSRKCLKLFDFLGFIFSATIVLFSIILQYSTENLTKARSLYIYDFITLPMRVAILLSVVVGRMLCLATPLHGYHSRGRAICSMEGIIDILTTVPALTIYAVEAIGSGYYDVASQIWPTLLMLDILRLKRLQRVSHYIDNAEVYSIILDMSLLILFTANLMIVITEFTQADEKLPLHDWVFFVMTTVSTIGYGSTVVSVIGRLFVIIMMIILLSRIPSQGGQLMHLLSRQSVYSRQKYKVIDNIKHVVVTGNVTFISLRDLLNEMFHDDHGQNQKHTVLLLPSKPDSRILSLISLPRFASVVYYIQGSPQSPKDLRRAAAQRSKAIIMLTNKQARFPQQEDSKIILRAMMIKEYLKYNCPGHGKPNQIIPPICMQMLRPEGVMHFELSATYREAVSDQIVCIQRLKLSLLAKSCLCPGLVALISNLVISMKDVALEFRQQGQVPPRWINEYCKGNQHEIYHVLMNLPDKAITFTELANAVFQRYGVIMFALQIKDELRKTFSTMIYLNPGNSFTIPLYDSPEAQFLTLHCYAIASDQKAALNIFLKPLTVKDTKVSFPFVELQVQGGGNVRLHRSPHFEKLGRDRQFKRFHTNQFNSPGYKSEQKLRRGSTKRIFGELKSDDELYPTEYALQAEQEEEENEAQKGVSDNRLLLKQCHLTPSKVELEDVTFPTLQDSKLANNHIVVCGIVNNIRHFVMPLRHTYLNKIQPIVILHTEKPVEQWAQLAYFPQIFFVQGSPLNKRDLKRVNIAKASRVVVLKPDEPRSSQHGSQASDQKQQDVLLDTSDADLETQGRTPSFKTQQEHMMDAPTIFKYKIVRKAVKAAGADCFITTELVSHQNLPFLLESPLMYFDLYKYGYANTPTYASGAVYLSTMMDALIAQTYFNETLLTVLNQLLVGETSRSFHTSAFKDTYNFSKIQRSNLFSIEVPKSAQGRTFGQFFQNLTSLEIIPIGLYRRNSDRIQKYPTGPEPQPSLDLEVPQASPDLSQSQRSQGKSLSEDFSEESSSQGRFGKDENYRDFKYVIICPEVELELQQGDSAFVLALEEPNIEKIKAKLSEIVNNKGDEDDEEDGRYLSISAARKESRSEFEEDQSPFLRQNSIYQTKANQLEEMIHKESPDRRAVRFGKSHRVKTGKSNASKLFSGELRNTLNNDLQPQIKKLKENVVSLEKELRESASSLMPVIQQAFNEELEVQKEELKFKQQRNRMQERRNSKFKRHQSTFAQRSTDSKESIKVEHLHPHRAADGSPSISSPLLNLNSAKKFLQQKSAYLNSVVDLKETLDEEDERD